MPDRELSLGDITVALLTGYLGSLLANLTDIQPLSPLPLLAHAFVFYLPICLVSLIGYSFVYLDRTRKDPVAPRNVGIAMSICAVVFDVLALLATNLSGGSVHSVPLIMSLLIVHLSILYFCLRERSRRIDRETSNDRVLGARRATLRKHKGEYLAAFLATTALMSGAAVHWYIYSTGTTLLLKATIASGIAGLSVVWFLWQYDVAYIRSKQTLRVLQQLVEIEDVIECLRGVMRDGGYTSQDIDEALMELSGMDEQERDSTIEQLLNEPLKSLFLGISQEVWWGIHVKLQKLTNRNDP